MKEVKLTLAQAKRYEVIERSLQGRMTNQEAANAFPSLYQNELS